jgi:microcystin-dependent protein
MKIATIFFVVAGLCVGTSTSAQKPAQGMQNQKAPSAPVLLKDGAYAGEIRAFAGEVCPKGWLAADGKSYNDTAYANLAPVISDLWGSPNPNTFRVPDLRGVFLRGWNAMGTQGNRQDKYADPDAIIRELPPGAPVSSPNPDTNVVGSYQQDAIQAHHHSDSGHAHDMNFTYQNSFSCGNSCGALTVPTSGNNNTKAATAVIGDPTNSTGGPVRISTESRPANAYVLYCVRDGNPVLIP